MWHIVLRWFQLSEYCETANYALYRAVVASLAFIMTSIHSRNIPLSSCARDTNLQSTLLFSYSSVPNSSEVQCRCSHQYTVFTHCFHPKRKQTTSLETSTIITYYRNVILMFLSFHLSIGVFLRCNFFVCHCHCIVLFLLYLCTFVGWFLIKYQYSLDTCWLPSVCRSVGYLPLSLSYCSTYQWKRAGLA